MEGLTVSRKFMEIFNLLEQKDSYHTIKNLEVELTFQQTESDSYTPSGINLMKNEPFTEILSCCLVRIPYTLLWELLNKYLPSNYTHVLMTVQIQNMQSLK